MGDPSVPHEPTPECAPLHCWWHNTDEPDGGYRACFECRHVYATAEDLREAWRAEVAVAALPGAVVVVPPADEIGACPLCAHDWLTPRRMP